MKNSRGFTFVELTMTIVVASILAGAFVQIMAPQMNLYFFLPQKIKIQSTAADLMDIMVEGDGVARGLRYAKTATGTAITAATATSLTYSYATDDGASHTAILSFTAPDGPVTRQVDGGSAEIIPYYATPASQIRINTPGSFFRYYDSLGVEMIGGGIVLANIYRVDILYRVLSGSGAVLDSQGNTLMKTRVEIKHFVSEVPDF